MMLGLLHLGACAGPGGAPAPDHPDVVAALMARVDTDGDGVVSAAEYQRVAFADDPMETYDADGDKVLRPYEIESMLRDASPSVLARKRQERFMQEAERQGDRFDLGTTRP